LSIKNVIVVWSVRNKWIIIIIIITIIYYYYVTFQPISRALLIIKGNF